MVSRLKDALAGLKERHPEKKPTASFFVTDGKDVYLRESEQVVEDLRRGQLVFAFVLELNGLRKEIRKRLARRA